MAKAVSTVYYDEKLRLEAYYFHGFTRSFPNHFHEHYVIGLVEGGQRQMQCRGQKYSIGPGSIILLNPGDNHACVQTNGTFTYFSLAIGKNVMLDLAETVGSRQLPCFTANVVYNGEAACYLRELRQLMLAESREFAREEKLLLLLRLLWEKYSLPFACCLPKCRREVEKVCAFLQKHYGECLNLDTICRSAGMGKSALIRAFTQAKGVTPYRYLQSLRIGAAKKMLEQSGVSLLDVALQAGFADQSHFTNFFKLFIGLTPGGYRDIVVGRRLRKTDNKEGDAGV